MAATGVVTIGGIAFEQLALVAGALVIVGVAAVATRFRFRRDKGVGQQ